MKNLLLKAAFIISFLVGVKAYSQEVQLATLQHGENMQVFYGSNALIDALAVADHGDLINLTAGTFNSTTINKAITLQGAGYITDATNGKFPTIISGDLNIQLSDGDTGLVIEGISHNSGFNINSSTNSFILKKSIIGVVDFKANSMNCLIDQCRIGTLNFYDKEHENMYIKNSIMQYLGSNSPLSTLFVENCVITDQVDANREYNGTTAFFRNNIIGGVNWGYGRDGSLKNSCKAYNNVFIQGNDNDVAVKSENVTVTAMALFGKESIEWSADGYRNETYQLTPEAKVTYLGTDGTQVGIYGGPTPFTNVPTNPQITAKSIDSQSSADGKLRVSITVEAQK